MQYRNLLILVPIFFSISSCASKGDQSSGLILGLSDSVTNLFKGTTVNKPMKSCHLAEPLAGFNHAKRKVDLCTEEQLAVIRPYFGTYEGTISGDTSGSIKIEISDGGVIHGECTTGGEKFIVRGRASFIVKPLDKYLYIQVGSGGKIGFNGNIREDGLLSTNWDGSVRKGANGRRIGARGSVSLHKTAPYRKRVTQAKAADPAVKKNITHSRKNNKPLRTNNNLLFDAARKGLTSRIDKLVRAGYDLTAVDENGATAFCVALKYGHRDTAQRLMAFGSDKNHKDKKGWTPLHYAAIYNDEIMAGALIYGGVDKQAKDNRGKTARDWAAEKKHDKVVLQIDNASIDKLPPHLQKALKQSK